MAFPTTGTLDSFSRANEDPIATGWMDASPYYFVAGDTGFLALLSNKLTNATGGGTDTSSGWDASSFTAPLEIWATITTASAVATDAFKLLAMTAISDAAADGYELHVEKSAGTDIWRIRRRDNVTPTTLGADMSQEIASGDSVGLSISSGTITAYYKSGAGAWTTVGTRTDSTYTGTFYIGVKTVQSVSGAWKAAPFGGGAIGGGAPSFPATSLLDDFTRANNASLGANWTEAVNGKTNRAEIISNAVSVTGTGASSINAYTGAGAVSSTWVAVRATAAAVAAATTDTCGLGVTKVSDTTKGYHAEVDTTGTDVGVTFWNDSLGTQIGSVDVATGYGQLAAGNDQGFVAHDTGTQTDLEFWILKSGTWTQVATQSATGGDYIAGPYYASLRTKYSTESIDNFQAAALTAPPGGSSSGPIRAMLMGVG